MSGSRTRLLALAVVLLTSPALGAAPAVAAPFAASEMTVPPALWRHNETIEPSGVAWAAPLARYLVVSDDTGEGRLRHAPWVLAMDRAGRLDADPVLVVGVDRINDAESICPGPGGTFFLVTSHSRNKKGHLKPERRMLLQLALRGRALHVVGKVDLTTAQGDKGEPLLGIAGLPLDGPLDIEAIHYRAGSDELLVGLKAPLSARGAAVMLRLSRPARALGRRRIPRGAVSRVGEYPLRVDREGASVGEGISDLTALPDGSLLLLANSPKGMPSDGGGSMYRLRPGAAAPELLRRFPGLKPEGLTLTDDGRGILVVFDNDTRPPLWARLPLPGAERAP